MSDADIFQVQVFVAGREAPVGLAFRRFLDAQKATEDLAGGSLRLQDDFGHLLALGSPAVGALLISPEQELEMGSILALLQARAQAAFQNRAAVDSRLRASQALSAPQSFMPRG